jgi:hypothetical protein
MATSNNREVTGWVGWVAFAAFMMILGGVFQAFVGLTAIVKDQFFVATPNYLVTFDVTTWGWIHLIVSILVVVAGAAVLRGKVWGRSIGVLLVLVSALANLAFIPYYPLWSTLIIVIDVLVAYALIVHGGELAE